MLFGMGASFLANKVYPMTGGAEPTPEAEDKGALGLGPGTPPEPKQELVPSPDAPTPKLAEGTAPLTSDKLFDTPAPPTGLGSSALADDDVQEGGGVEYDDDTEDEEEDSEEEEEEAEAEDSGALPPFTFGGINTTWINPHAGFTPMNTNGLTYQF